ncbi:MAG: PKD domain-containing protein, partial [Maribacter sp.]
PLLVNFDGSGSTDDIAVTDYSWDFGNGESATGALASYTYPTAGSYVATLTVTDAEGLSDTDTINITVSSITGNTAPIAVAASDVMSGTAPLTINFDASGSSDDNGIISHSWDFGNGDNGVGSITSYTYPTAGSYVATLTVTDAEGLSDTDTISITVTSDNPEVNETELKDIIVCPNPVGNENLNFDLSGFMDESIGLGFYDIYGKLVFQNIVNKDHPDRIAIDVSFLSDGFYLVEIIRLENNEFTYKKIIKAENSTGNCPN